MTTALSTPALSTTALTSPTAHPSPALAATAQHSRGRPRRRRHHLDAVLVAAAAMVGLWFGVGAPAVSPVAPPAGSVLDSTTVVVAAPAVGDQAPTDNGPQGTHLVDHVVGDHHGGHGGHR